MEPQPVNISSVQDALLVAFSSVLAKIISFIPVIIFALLVVFVGFFIARWAKWLTLQLLKSLRLSKILKKSPVDNFLKKAQLTNKIEDIISNLVRWLVFLVFLIAAINLLGLTTVSSFLDRILAYIPTVFSAALILTLGTLIAGFVESLIKGALSDISRSSARLAGKVSSYLIIVFTILAAFAELGIAENVINILFIGFTATVSIALGLSFGLGAKDIVARILEDWYHNLKKDLK